MAQGHYARLNMWLFKEKDTEASMCSKGTNRTAKVCWVESDDDEEAVLNPTC